MHMNDVEEEFKLAEQMKNLCSDESGRETHPSKAAEIFYKIGSIYRKRSPDKIALLVSAGLFNAAIVRNPSNITQIRSDLNETCRHVLQKANAKNQNVNLVEKTS